MSTPFRHSHVRSAVCCAALVALGCKGEGATSTASTSTPVTPTAKPLVVRLDRTSARVGEVIQVIVASEGLTSASFSATIGTTVLAVTGVNDSTLVALLPSLTPGAYSLTVSTGGRSGVISVDVQAPANISNPVAVVSAALATAALSVPVTAPSGVTTAEWAQYRRVADSLRTESERAFAAASPAEQLAVARILLPYGFLGSTAAASATAPLALNSTQVLFLSPACRSAMSSAIAKLPFSIPLIAAAGAIWLLPKTPVTAIAGGIALGIAYNQSALRISDIAIAGVTCIVPEALSYATSSASALRISRSETAVAFAGTAGTPAPVMLQAGVPTLFFPAVSRRELDRRDLTDPVVAEYSRLVDQFRAVLSSVPFLRWIVGSPGAIAQSPSVWYGARPDEVLIQNVQPATVQIAASPRGESLQLVGTGSVTGDTPFSFDLVLVADRNIALKVQGTLQVTATQIVIDAPGVLVAVGSTFPLTARVSDANGKAVANVPVTWTSSDPTIATITPAGVFTGITQGQVNVTGRLPSGTSATVKWTVYPRLLDTKWTASWSGVVPYPGACPPRFVCPPEVYTSASTLAFSFVQDPFNPTSPGHYRLTISVHMVQQLTGTVASYDGEITGQVNSTGTFDLGGVPGCPHRCPNIGGHYVTVNGTVDPGKGDTIRGSIYIEQNNLAPAISSVTVPFVATRLP